MTAERQLALVYKIDHHPGDPRTLLADLRAELIESASSPEPEPKPEVEPAAAKATGTKKAGKS